MEWDDIRRRRRTTRSFSSDPVPPDVLDRILDAGRRGPSAGFSQGSDFVVLEGPDQTRVFWETTTDARWRSSTRRHAGTLSVPVIVIPLADAGAYTKRYAEADKAGSGLDRAEAWPVPYWLIDTSFAAMLIQLAAINEGLGVFFFGIFRGESELKAHLGIPPDRMPIGALAMGWAAPDSGADEPASPSLARGRRPRSDVIHRRVW
ncbi:MAG: nitroreductase family protein [Acidimicrobiales bacterium]